MMNMKYLLEYIRWWSQDAVYKVNVCDLQRTYLCAYKTPSVDPPSGGSPADIPYMLFLLRSLKVHRRVHTVYQTKHSAVSDHHNIQQNNFELFVASRQTNDINSIKQSVSRSKIRCDQPPWFGRVVFEYVK